MDRHEVWSAGVVEGGDVDANLWDVAADRRETAAVARDAANSAADHADKAAAAADDAAEHAGEAIEYAERSTAYAEAAVAAANTASKAATEAREVEKAARDSETARIAEDIEIGIEEAHLRATAETEDATHIQQERTQAAQTSQEIKDLIAAAEAALSAGDTTKAVTSGQQAAVKLLGSTGKISDIATNVTTSVIGWVRALPPNSIEVRSTLADAWASSSRPTAVEPVKETLRSRGSFISASDTSAASAVGRRFKTSAGRPASIRTVASAMLVSGVCGAGLRTIVHPAATAGAILRAGIARGAFQGVISRHGPTGWRMTRTLAVASSLTFQVPSMRTASSANQRKYPAA